MATTLAKNSAPDDSLVQSLKKTFPPALVSLVQEIVRPTPEFDRIAVFNRSDPVLTANILTSVNSPLHALSQKILDLKRADRASYKTKEAGCNRIVIATETTQ